MKKSEIYNLAQIAVLKSQCISPENKIEMLRVLFEDEDLAIYCEDREIDRLVAELAADEE
jgi:hypothetical protein